MNKITGETLNNCAMRQTARGMLETRIEHLRRQADQLEALKNALPELPEEADTALWRLLCDASR